MYPDVHFLGGKLVTVGGMGVTTKAHQTPRRLTLFSLRYHHEGDSQPLVVDLEAASKPSQTFRGTNHKLIPHWSTPTA